VRRLYELVPGISDGVIELVQPEFCYLWPGDPRTATRDDLKRYSEAWVRAGQVERRYFYRHEEAIPHGLLERLLFSYWSGVYDHCLYTKDERLLSPITY